MLDHLRKMNRRLPSRIPQDAAVMRVSFIQEDTFSHRPRETLVIPVEIRRAFWTVTKVAGIVSMLGLSFAIGNRQPAVNTVALAGQSAHIVRQFCRNPK